MSFGRAETTQAGMRDKKLFRNVGVKYENARHQMSTEAQNLASAMRRGFIALEMEGKVGEHK